MNRENQRIECVSETLDQLGITATEEQIKTIVRDLSLHIEMENELDSYQHIGYKEPCKQCASLKDELNRANKEIEVYNSSVKRRRNAQLATEKKD